MDGPWRDKVLKQLEVVSLEEKIKKEDKIKEAKKKGLNLILV